MRRQGRGSVSVSWVTARRLGSILIFKAILTAKRAKTTAIYKEYQDKLCALRVILATFAVDDVLLLKRDTTEAGGGLLVRKYVQKIFSNVKREG